MNTITVQGYVSIFAFGKTIDCTCLVRNEINGLRGKCEVVYSTLADGTQGYPYYPRQFPKGTWNVFAPLPRTGPYEAPWFIPTDAHQSVQTWELDADGCYAQPAPGIVVEDYAYGLHHSVARETYGCIKIATAEDVVWIAQEIAARLKAGEGVQVVVT